MTGPVASVDAKARAELLNGKKIFGTGILGIFTAIGGYVVGVFVGGPQTGAIVGFAFPFVGLLGLEALNIATTRYEFYDDRVVTSGLVRSNAVSYDEVAFVVRSASGGDTRSGTADFELVREDADNVELMNAADPNRVEQILNDRLPGPDEWLNGRDDRDTALRAFVRQRRQLAEQDQDVSADDGGRTVAVFGPDQFEKYTGVDPAKARLNQLGSLDGVQHVEDVDPSDIGPDTGRVNEPAAHDPGDI